MIFFIIDGVSQKWMESCNILSEKTHVTEISKYGTEKERGTAVPIGYRF